MSVVTAERNQSPLAPVFPVAPATVTMSPFLNPCPALVITMGVAFVATVIFSGVANVCPTTTINSLEAPLDVADM